MYISKKYKYFFKNNMFFFQISFATNEQPLKTATLFFFVNQESTLYVKWFLDLLASSGYMFKFQNFVRIILLLIAFMVLMWISTAIKLI